MDSYKETFETWDKVAKLYQDKFMDLEIYNASYDIFCEKIIKKKPSILEIGCGPGNITQYLLKKRPDFKIEAIDISPNMLKLAKMNNPSATFKAMDCRVIDKIETKFDAIICGFCIPYLSKSDCKKFIKDCEKLLFNNGIIYLSFVEGNYTKSGYQTGSSGDRTYFYYHSFKNLSRELKNNSFEIIKLLEIRFNNNKRSDEMHTIIIANKK